MTTLTDEQILEIASEYQTVVPGNCLYIVEFARALLSASKPAAHQDSRYIVIGYGESDYPQASFANDQDELLDAVLGMIYTRPSDACDDTREEYRRDLADEDEWCGKVWRTEFEIGGIIVYDTGASASPAIPAQSAEPVYQIRDDIRKWIDVDKDMFERSQQEERRIVYTIPQSSRTAVEVSNVKRFPTPISISTDKICEIASKYNLGNPRLDALRGFVNEVIIVNEAEYAKS